MSDFEDDPFRSPQSAGPAKRRPNRGEDSSAGGLILAVAIINYIFGAFHVACGGCVAIFGGGLIAMIASAIAEDQQMQPQGAVVSVASGVVIVVGIVIALLGLPVILAGYGVQSHENWGRILTFVVSAISGLIALFWLISLNPIGVFYGGYTVFTLVVLLKDDAAQLFK
ncbi:hypothetical protein ACYFX5_10000 [Bremerella sp. T1]|uniref:hypothetical protein n=1 Tax=Bremerella sp. TYQ1 TaxID=3119568 RepID=UPI001CCA6734|nr:hypothetical protein [Bremerella volcania]UBM38584.1 hypothetical protein LA756_11950 [Bremerella volcania]